MISKYGRVLLWATLLVGMVGTVSAQGFEYRLNETSGSTVFDYSGFDNDGILNGGVTQGVTGVSKNDGLAYGWDGGSDNDDYIRADKNFDVNGFTAITFAYPTNIDSDRHRMITSTETDGNWGWGTSIRNGAWDWEIRDDSGNAQGISAGSPSSNTWRCVAGVYDDGNNQMELYVYDLNNNLVASNSKNLDASPANVEKLIVGVWQDLTNPNDEWVGKLDEPIVSNQDYTQSEIKDYCALNEPPSIDSVSTSPINWTVGDNVDFSYDVSDSDGTISNVTLEVFNATSGTNLKTETFSYSSSSVSDTQTGWFTPQNKGDYTVYFTAVDNDGAETVETLSKTAQPAADTTPPDITIHSPQEGGVYDTSVLLEVSANESVSNWQYSLDGGSNQAFTPNTSLTLSGGSHTLDVFTDDDAGNTGAETVSFEVDDTPPTFDYTNVIPDPVELFNFVSYNVSTTDPNGIIENCLTVTYGTQTVYSKNCKVGPVSGNTALSEWVDVYNVTTANKWLNATFETLDSKDNTRTTELNRFVEDTRPSFQINDPDNQTYIGQTIPYQVDFNDDGDSDPNETAYCRAYNDGSLVRNASVSENQATTFSGDLTNVPYGYHEFKVSCVETDILGNTTTNKSVFYSNEEKPTSFTLNSPLDGESFSYLEGKGGTDILFSGSSESDYSVSRDVYLEGSSIYNDNVGSGVSSYEFNESLSSATYDYYVEVTSDDTGNVYTSNTLTFSVNEVNNPPPSINQVNYDSTIQQFNFVEFDFRTSDATDNLDNYTINVYDDNGVVSSESGSLSGTDEWVNNSQLFSPQVPVSHTIELSVSDNYGFTTSNNYSVSVDEAPVDFDLVSPNHTVETGGAIDYNTSFKYGVDLPSNGLIELFISEPDESGFFKDGNESLQDLQYSGRSIVFELNNISYNNVAGEDYRASGKYEWYLRYTSNATGNTYTSNILSWRFIDTAEPDEPVEDEGINLLGILFWIFVVILLILPLWIKYRWMD